MAVTEDGMERDDNDLQFSKHPNLMVVNEEDSAKSTLSRETQFWKHLLGNSVSEAGSEIDLSDWHPENVCADREVRVDGNETLSKAQQLPKHWSGKEVMPSWMMIDLSSGHLPNHLFSLLS